MSWTLSNKPAVGGCAFKKQKDREKKQTQKLVGRQGPLSGGKKNGRGRKA